MFSSGDRRRLDQESGFWFKPFGLQQPTRPTPLPTQTTQTVTAIPPPQPPAARKPPPATRPLGSTPSQAQPTVGSTSTANRVPRSSTASPTAPSQVPRASTMSPTATRQSPHRASPSQTQRQSPLKPGSQPKQTNVSTKIPPPSGPSSSTKPPIQTQSSTEKSTEPQEDLKGLNSKPTSQIQEVPTSRLPRPEPEPTKIVDVEPTKPASPSVIKHEDEPKTISNREIVKSATKVEIFDRASATDLGSKQHKSEDDVKIHSKQKQTPPPPPPPSPPPPPPKHDQGTKVDHGALIPHQGTETKKESHQEKQRQTSAHSRKTDSSAEMRDAVNTANSDIKETKTVVQVKQKDKHLEGEVYQKEKIPQHVDQSGTHRDAKEGITRLLHKKADDGPQKKSGEDEPVRVVTLAGENRGAQMDINNGGNKRKDGALHIHRSHKLEDDDKGGRFGVDDEESHKVSEDSEKPLTAYINNNTQSVNNSIIYHSACNSNNPGVHLNVTNTAVERMWQPRRDGYGGIDKPGVISQAHRLTAEPSVRRRCLRSLFMESSDSDLENAGKPRRHGCRYVCPVERVAPLRVTSEDLNANSNE